MLQVEYFAILFTIVYVGAIVVLFLFIVMMLEIKMVNVSERFRDLFSFRNIIISFLLLEVLLLTGEDFFELPSAFNFDSLNNFLFFREANLYVDYSKLLQHPDHLRGIGGVLFTEYKLSVLLAALLLFLSMIGSIVVTMETSSLKTIKAQDPNHQALRHPSLLGNSFRGL
jgi:NADH:ubiquinone oxidoreductase subunit 6 (subunit J)